MRALRRLRPDVCLLAASVVAAAAVGHLFEGGLGGRAFDPLLVAAAVGSAIPALLTLQRVPAPMRAVVGTVAVILTSLWTAIGAATTFGLPTERTLARRSVRPARGAAAARAIGLPAPTRSGTRLPGGDGLRRRGDARVGPAARQRHTRSLVPRHRAHLSFVPPCIRMQPKHAGDDGGLRRPLRRRRSVDLCHRSRRLATQVRQASATTSRRGSWVTPIAVTACTMAAVVLVAVLVRRRTSKEPDRSRRRPGRGAERGITDLQPARGGGPRRQRRALPGQQRVPDLLASRRVERPPQRRLGARSRHAGRGARHDERSGSDAVAWRRNRRGSRPGLQEHSPDQRSG